MLITATFYAKVKLKNLKLAIDLLNVTKTSTDEINFLRASNLRTLFKHSVPSIPVLAAPGIDCELYEKKQFYRT